MSSFGSVGSLIVSAFDLYAVNSVVGAIRAADLESGDVATPSGIIEKPEPAPAQNVDRYESSSQVQPQEASRLSGPLSYERPRSINSQSASHHVSLLAKRPVSLPCHLPCDVAPEPASVPSNPIQPPWKLLPWMEHIPRRVIFVREIKFVVTGADMSLRGKMLDLVA